MSFSALAAMRQSQGLQQRVTACAAMEGVDFPDQWSQLHTWKIIARPDWVDAFAYAEDNKTANVNQDTGARTDVINDGMILAAVQAVRAEEEQV